MGPWAPINGISLERYAELAADVSDTQDPAQQAAIVAQKGVAAHDWEAAKAGWSARMQDPSLMGQVATQFMTMYQAALSRKSPAPQVSYEDYVAMCGCPPVMGFEGMLAHYKLTTAQWTQIAGQWNQVIATNPQYMQHGMRVEAEAARIRAGGAPRPVSIGGAPAIGSMPPPQEPSLHAVTGGMPGHVPPPAVSGSMPGAVPLAAVSGAMPGAVPPPGYGAPQPGSYAPPPLPPPQPPYPAVTQWNPPPPQPPPGYAMPPGYAPQPPPQPPPQAWPQQQPGYPPQQQGPGYNQQAAQLGNQVGGALSAFGSALGGMVSSVTGSFSHNQKVIVQWTDGNRYPATVMIQQSGQVQVKFPDGRQVWVPQHCCVAV